MTLVTRGVSRIAAQTPKAFLVLAALLGASSFALYAQNPAGSISGIVQDSQGAVIPDARLTLLNAAQGAATARQLVTSAEGTFVFSPVLPGTYTLTVEVTGFKKYVQSGIVLDVNDKLGLPPIALEVGATGESVTVEASAVQLQTVTAERAGVVTGRQMVDLALNGRNLTGLLKTVQGGNVDTNNFNGQRTDQMNFTVDGQVVIDSGVNALTVQRINVDAITEFKVSTNSMGAEYGRNSGAQVQVVTKSGTRDFHGTGYWFKRGEFMNANTFVNNTNRIPRQIYRYMTLGYNLSGPIYIPKKFNTSRDRLFFFMSEEWNRAKTPGTLQQITVPTVAQRQGDFSNTRDGAGVLQTIKDPQTGAPFPDGVIPSSRFNQYGQAVLNFLPLPNVTGNPLFNYTSQFTGSSPQFDEVYKIDYNLNQNWRFFVRGIRNQSTTVTPYGTLASQNVLGLSPLTNPTGMWAYNIDATTIISPTLTNEALYGKTMNYIPGNAPPAGSPYYAKNSGLQIPLLYPNADPIGLVPNFGFLGVPGGSSNFPGGYYSLFVLPYFNENPISNFTDNITKVRGTHTIKAGFYFETQRKSQTPYGDVNSSIQFARDSGNPGDTNWAFSNALLGNFQQYTQLQRYVQGNYLYHNVEWYGQDSWKITPKLTLNYGLRFSLVPPTYESGNQIAGFDPSLWNPAKTVTLYQPALAGGQKVALNPLTGQTAAVGLIGAVVPGSGDPNNGEIQAGVGGYPRGLANSRGVQWGPRIGFAYSLNNKTVLRMGGGAFYERAQGGPEYYQIANPPVLRQSQITYGNLSNIAGSATAQFPVAASGISRDGHIPTVYNYSAGLQRELPMGLLLDVSYVGSQSRHLITLVPFNDLPFGSAWLPQNQDPTVTPKYDGTTTLPPNLYRPYLGVLGPTTSNISNQGYITTYGGSANYNGLQLAVNRRAARGLNVGMQYSWAKSLGTASGTSGGNMGVYPSNIRHTNYGPLTFDRTQSLSFNYIYNIPGVARTGTFLDNVAGRLVLNGWQFSGLTSISSGAPINVTYSVTGISAALLNREITGSEDIAPRVVMTCNPNQSLGDRNINAFINTSCFAPAAKGSVGADSGYNRIRGPGLDQWDMSLFKRIPVGAGEARYVQLRLEAFNAFNHVEWNTMNAVAQFNAAGQLVNLPSQLGGAGGRFGFGALNTVRLNSQRIVQVAAKFYF
jgi:hypothetical protein